MVYTGHMEVLITIFIGLVAVALIIIAAGIGAVAWYLVKFLQELTIITRRLHEAGEIVAADLAEVRSVVKQGGVAQFIYQIAKNLWPKKKPLKKSPPPQD